MMEPVFLDTGFLIALEVADDRHHNEARAYWSKFVLDLPPLITTSIILVEIITHFSHRGRHARAVEIGHRLLQSP